MPNNNSYLTGEDAERYYDAIEAANYHRMRQVIHYTTRYEDEFERAKAAVYEGKPVTIGGHYGLVLEVKAPLHAMLDGHRLYEITFRPMQEPRDLAAEEKARQEAMQFLAEQDAMKWWRHPNCRCSTEELDELLINLEDGMKVFEAIVVNVNEQNEVTGIAQGTKLVVAKTAQAAKEQVLVDYAQENHLAGKDLTGFQVRTREFLSAV